MQPDVQKVPVSKTALWAGRIISTLPTLFLLMDGVMKLFKPKFVVEATVQLGYSENVIVGLGIVLTACTVLYVIPQTAVLGAVLLAGYLGGADGLGGPFRRGDIGQRHRGPILGQAADDRLADAARAAEHQRDSSLQGAVFSHIHITARALCPGFGLRFNTNRRLCKTSMRRSRLRAYTPVSSTPTWPR